MAVPEKIDNHVTIALGKLLEQFKGGKPVLHGLIRTHVGQLQDLEDVAWQCVHGRLLDYPPGGTVRAEGVQLDVLGKIVGAPRLGVTDSQYRDAIKLQIRVNRSHGTTVDILEVLRLAMPSPATFTYREHRHLAWYTYVSGSSTSLTFVLLNALNRSRAAGTRNILEYHTDRVAPSALLKWAGVTTGGGLGGFGTVQDATRGSKLTSKQG